MRANTSSTPSEQSTSNPDSFAAICKECGNGTLNNAATNSFKILQGYGSFEDQSFVVCRVCGSHHVDVVEAM